MGLDFGFYIPPKFSDLGKKSWYNSIRISCNWRISSFPISNKQKSNHQNKFGFIKRDKWLV